MAFEKILLIDDEENILMLYEHELLDEGYQVLLANNAREGIEKLKRESVDLVILDIRMPAMDGLEALGKILGLKKEIPIILNTAYSNYKDDFMSWAADAYVVKSSDLTQLKTTIRDVLNKKKSGS
ncbi:MAG: response regulator [Proteobacteria bacterium]|nr:response regulator [Pseudomonadota bacterium]